MSDNVLLHLGEEPRFDQIKTEDIKPALQTAIAEAREQIAAIKAQTHTDWANTVEKLTDITVPPSPKSRHSPNHHGRTRSNG